VQRTNIREGHVHNGEPEVERLGDSDGVGDLSLFGQYRFFRERATQIEVAFLAGLRMPAGDTGVSCVAVPEAASMCAVAGAAAIAACSSSQPGDDAGYRAAHKACVDMCSDIFADNPENLPGSGPDYFGRQRRCIRECMRDAGYSY
jgi:hypothetical protein